MGGVVMCMLYEHQDEPLHVRMCWAAVVLEAANQHCGMPRNAAWTAAQLRKEAGVVASER